MAQTIWVTASGSWTRPCDNMLLPVRFLFRVHCVARASVLVGDESPCSLVACAQNEEIVQLVHERAQQGDAPQDIAQHLVRTAMRHAEFANLSFYLWPWVPTCKHAQGSGKGRPC